MEDNKIQKIIELVRDLSDEEIRAYNQKTQEYLGRPQTIMRRIWKQRSNILVCVVKLKEAVETMPD